MPLSRVEDACAAMAFTRSKLRRDEVLDIYFKYSFPFDYRVILPGADMAASDSPGSSCRAVLFEEQFAAGLRFPLDSFLVEVCRDLKVALGQLYPGTIKVVLAFSEACRLRGCAPSLKVLYHFVDFRKCDGCFVFALGREGRSRIYLPCLTSRWRRRFFIVYHKFVFLHFSDGFSSHQVRSCPSPLSLSESKLAFDISSCSIESRPILDVLVNSRLRRRWFPLEDPPRGLADLCYSFVQDLDVPMGGPDVPIANIIPDDIDVDGAPVDIPIAPAEIALPEVIVVDDDDDLADPWVEGQDPASLLNPRVLAEYIRTLAIPDDVTEFYEIMELELLYQSLSLSDDEDLTICDLGEKARSIGEQKVANSLFGKVLSTKKINRDGIISTVNFLWKTRKPMVVEAVGDNHFICQFESQEDRRRVLTGGPWKF
ncbi:uncharacterized protein LOC126673130 [Mercurialis annua]|uniref:uncharacterized protein LOC126673130 n=1 Tax=Mercurialis annua TaxID=3986 RepID=UPI00215E440A|nr:uncharacterized protein LOC126673130 [Mercurialis annua]